jgi:putative heme-binding domain-containing protein
MAMNFNLRGPLWLLALSLFVTPALSAADAKKNKAGKKAAPAAKAEAKKDDPFAAIIRPTDPRTAADELKSFHLPPGFEIQLVASEPDIAKPMNLAFDARGRLWVAESREYPFPAPLDKKGRDAVKVLDQFGADGRAGRISTFAEGLNIPIGLHPYKDGALIFSIPNIYHFRDTNGDGKADQQETVLGRFGFEKDTHGLTSSFRRGYDGWIYADHGFNNDTFLTAKDGSTLKLNSGNCYRFRPDGSHVEIHSWGQVNPYGLMFDPVGDLWSADCHSLPVYMLLRGAYYPSFGKPHDGLGFGPAVMKHLHGSTAIAGIVYYAADQFPAEFAGNTFVGNVMTCRINRDSYEWRGSTRIAKEEPDFLSSDDPWFRPVDIQLGPDGALYVADFYNRIIGHYETPLDHPGRDRERGRIWRIVYRGNQAASPPPAKLALPTALDGLLAELAGPNLTRRMLALNELVDRIGKPAIAPLLKLVRDRQSTTTQKINSLWALSRLGALEPGVIATAAQSPDRDLRVHAMRVLSEIPHWTSTHRKTALAGLLDKDALVQRSAADALGQHGAYEHYRPLLAQLNRTPAADTTLLHMTRMSLRNQLAAPNSMAQVQLAKLTEPDARTVADIALAIPTADAAIYLLNFVQKYESARDTLTRYLRHTSRYLPPFQTDSLVAFSRRQFASDPDLQLTLFKSIQDGTAQRGGALSPETLAWGGALADQLMASIDESARSWANHPVEGQATSSNPWAIQERRSADGVQLLPFISSLPGGEPATGRLRSKKFTVPATLSFYLAGHDGAPGAPVQKKNGVRLYEAGTRAVLAEAAPPRSDVAQAVKWDLAAHAGKEAYLEIVDADEGRSYAWLAAGRFEPAVVYLDKLAPVTVSQRYQAAADLARSLMLTRLETPLTKLMGDETTDLETRAAVARALLALKPDEGLAALLPLVSDATTPAGLQSKISRSFVERRESAPGALVAEALHSIPYRSQVKVALALAGSPGGAESLLGLVERGQAPARLLLERTVKEKISVAKPAVAADRLTKLTANLVPASAELQALIDKRRAGYAAASPNAVQGRATFIQVCATCHRIDVTGGLVGPQLDGVGGRGLERLLEDILDPNRNVDGAFHTHTIILHDGDVVSGLPRREEGEVLVIAESTGKETAIPKKDIKERRESNLSLMPDNFSDVIPESDFYNLLAFLLSKGGGAK